MKKILGMLLTILLCLNIISYNVYATEKPKKLYVAARNAIAIDSKTKKILYDKNGMDKVPMASTTKIITASVAIASGDLDRKVVVSKNAVSIRGSKAGLKLGQEVTLRELVYGLMMVSGNDAAIAIAEELGGSVENFCNIMNAYARSIGLLECNFESPHGLDSRKHYSTAYDLAVAASKGLEMPEFAKIVGAKGVTKDEYNFSRDYNNINKILYRIPNANGVKTGYTGQAGKCLVSSIKQEDRNVVIVVLNCSDRWNVTEKIYNEVKDIR